MTLFGAIALFLAAPGAAQTIPIADPHAGHAQHQQQGAGGHAEHKMGCKCCDTAEQQGRKMECCADHAKEAPGEHKGHGTR